MKLCSQFWCFVDIFFPILPRGLFPKYLDKSISAHPIVVVVVSVCVCARKRARAHNLLFWYKCKTFLHTLYFMNFRNNPYTSGSILCTTSQVVSCNCTPTNVKDSIRKYKSLKKKSGFKVRMPDTNYLSILIVVFTIYLIHRCLGQRLNIYLVLYTDIINLM